jgi:hypothetical protein
MVDACIPIVQTRIAKPGQFPWRLNVTSKNPERLSLPIDTRRIIQISQPSRCLNWRQKILNKTHVRILICAPRYTAYFAPSKNTSAQAE